ncbi:MAG: SH3 domain-containing protein [Spirochaetota bacterium]
MQAPKGMRTTGTQIFILLVALVLFGCSGGEPVEQLELPTTQVLNVRAGWAVVEAPYSRILEQPEADSPIVGHARRGAVLEIVTKTNYSERTDDGTDFWYQIRSQDFSGWVFGSAVSLYNTRERAANAAEVLRDD